MKFLEFKEEKKNAIQSMLKNPCQFEVVKQIIAKDDPFICNLVLSQDDDIPDVGEGILNALSFKYWQKNI